MQVGIKQVTACFTSLSSFGLTSLSRVFSTVIVCLKWDCFLGWQTETCLAWGSFYPDWMPCISVQCPDLTLPVLQSPWFWFCFLVFFWWNVTLIILKGKHTRKQIKVLTEMKLAFHILVCCLLQLCLQRDGYSIYILYLKGHCLFQQDPWGMVKSGKALLQILPGMEKCSVLQHRKGWKEVLLEVFASLLYSLLSLIKQAHVGAVLLGAHSNSCTTLWICCHYDLLTHNPLFFSFAYVSLALAVSSP